MLPKQVGQFAGLFTTLYVVRHDLMEPMQSLNEIPAGTPCPIETAPNPAAAWNLWKSG